MKKSVFRKRYEIIPEVEKEVKPKVVKEEKKEEKAPTEEKVKKVRIWK